MRYAVVVLALLGACGGKKGGARRGGDGGTGVVLVDPRKALDAAAIPEVEPNDDRKHAQPFVAKPDGGPYQLDVSGVLDPPTDQDWFQFMVAAKTARHAVALRLSGTPGFDLAAELYDDKGKLVFALDDTGIGEPEAVPNLALEPGTYAVKLRIVPHRARKAKPGADAGLAKAGYILHISELEPPAGDELEPNDAPAFAAPLALGDSATGYLGWRKDHDVYKVALGSGADAGVGDGGTATETPLKIEIVPPPGVTPELTLYDATETKLLERRGRSGQPLVAGGLLARAGDPYVFVAVGSAGGRNADEKYTVHVDTDTVAPGGEREPNDTPDTAVLLGDGTPQKQGGSASATMGAGDVDYYRLPVAAGQLVRAEVTPLGDGDVALAVVGEGGKPVRSFDEAGKNGAEVLTGWAFPTDGELTLRVSAGGKAHAAEFPYRLTWALEPDDGKSEREPNDDFAHAMPISDVVRGTLGSRGDHDFFRLSSLPSVGLRVGVATPPHQGLQLTLYDEARKVIATAASPAGGGGFELTAMIDPLRTYTLELAAHAEAAPAPAKGKKPPAPAPLSRDSYELIVHSE